VALGAVSLGCGSPERPAPPPSSPAPLAQVVPGHAPAVPELGAAHWLASGGQPQDVLLHQGQAYVADVTGLAVYTVEPDGRLIARHHVPTPGQARDVTLSGGQLYVADGRAGVAHFSLDTPEQPRLLGSHAVPGPVYRIRGSEHGVAVLQEGGTLSLLRPGRSAAHLQLPGEPRDAAWVGPHLYVADTGDGLLRVDTTAEPLRVSWRDRTWRWAISLAAHEGWLLLGTRDKRVALLDPSRGTPRLLAELALAHGPVRLQVAGTSVLASGGDNAEAGATLLELAGTGPPRPGTRLPFAVLAATGLEPPFLLAARGAEGLQVLKATPSLTVHARVPGMRLERLSTSPGQVLAWNELGSGARRWSTSIAPLQGQELPEARWLDAVPCTGGWCTLDASGHLCHEEPARQPRAQRTCTPQLEHATSAAWQPGTGIVWISSANGALQGFTREPTWRRVAALETSPPAFRLTSLTVEGTRGVGVDAVLGKLYLFELGPSPRFLRGFLLQAAPSRVALSGGVALVAQPSAGLQLVDLRNPAQPRELAWVSLDPGPRDVAVWRPGGTQGPAWVAVAQGEAGVSLWHWDGDSELRLLRRSDTPGVASSVAFLDGMLWVADSTGVARFPLPEGAP
jgi:hypothetical protein